MKENLLNFKYKFNFRIESIKSFTEMKGVLIFLEHSFNFKIIDTFKGGERIKHKEIVKNIMNPIFYSDTEDCFYLNYSLIKSVKFTDNKITIEIFNPVNPSNMNLVLSKLESVGLVFNKSLSFEAMTNFCKFTQQRILHETRHLIEQFLLYFNVLKEGLYSTAILKCSEGRIAKGLLAGRKYYDKHITDLKKQDKLKSQIIKKMFDGSNQNWEKNNKNNIKTDEIYPNINNNYSNLYCNFDFILKEIKTKSVQLIEKTTVLFFQIASLELTMINFKDVCKEKISNHLKSMNEYDKGGITTATVTKNLIGMNMNNNNNNNNNNNRSFEFIPNKNNLDDSNNLNNSNNLNRSANIFNYNSSLVNNNEKNMHSENKNSISNLDVDLNKNKFTNINKIRDREREKEMKTYLTKGNNVIQNEYTDKPINATKDNFTIDTPKFVSKIGNNNDNIQTSHSINSNNLMNANISNHTVNTFNTSNTITNDRLGNTTTKINVDYLSYSQIVKKIEEAKSEHSLLPTNEFSNTIHNTLQIIHRKYFESSFEDFFSKIFTVEKDSNNLIKLDSIYNHFIYLRGLKNLLFTEKNKIFFSNVFFEDD